MENRIKEQQLSLFADWTSTSRMQSNQLRLYCSTIANAIMTIIKEIALKGTEMATAQCGTIRVRLLKIAAVLRVSTRRYRLSFSSAYPWRSLFARVLANLRAIERAPLLSAPSSLSDLRLRFGISVVASIGRAQTQKRCIPNSSLAIAPRLLCFRPPWMTGFPKTIWPASLLILQSDWTCVTWRRPTAGAA